MSVRLFFFALFVIFGTAYAMGNSGGELIEKQQWSKYAKGYDFTENFKQPKKNNKPVKPRNFKPVNMSWIKYLIWGVVIALLLVLITWLIVTIFKSTAEKVANQKSVNSLSIEDIEEADLEQFLDQSMAEGSFKEAIRIRYLMLIRTLSRLRLVVWKKDKTNGTYVNEMYGKIGFELFRQVTVSFERVWYGDKEIGEAEYHSVMPLFDQLNKMVRPNE
ncbi:MAG TPA: hypothetical protein VIH57_22650 [Bacteroidales bacterium]